MEQTNLISRIGEGDEQAFSLLFHYYYTDMVVYAGSMINNREECEDIVQELFVKLWQERGKWSVDRSLKGYLLQSVRNACLDLLRHQKIALEHHEYVLAYRQLSDSDVEHHILYSDLNRHLGDALKKLPDHLRVVFEMVRLHGEKQQAAANKLQISLRTVEDRLVKSTRMLKTLLREFKTMAW